MRELKNKEQYQRGEVDIQRKRDLEEYVGEIQRDIGICER